MSLLQLHLGKMQRSVKEAQCFALGQLQLLRLLKIDPLWRFFTKRTNGYCRVQIYSSSVIRNIYQLQHSHKQKGPMAIAGYRSTAHQLSEIFTSCSILILVRQSLGFWKFTRQDRGLISLLNFLLRYFRSPFSTTSSF